MDIECWHERQPDDRPWWSLDLDIHSSRSRLASIEATPDIEVARRRGYATALVVEQFAQGEKAFEAAGSRVLPCRAETARRTCIECRLCLQDRGRLANGMSIGFQVHGQHERAARATLARVAGSN
jgi:hypothetical protein